MKIGLLTHSVNPRGGVVHTLALAEALHDAGHDVTVMAPALPGQRFFRPVRCATALAPVTGTPGDMVHTVGSRIAAYVDNLAPLLARKPCGAFATPEPFDVLHCHDGIGGAALATLQDQGLIAGFVRTVHHLDQFTQPQLMAWQHRSVHQAQQVLCVSRLWQDTLARDHGIAADLVLNGVDAKRYTPQAQPGDAALARRLGVAESGPVLLCVGGVEERKNTLRLLQAFVLLRRQLPQAQLVVAGGASLLDHADYGRAFTAAVQAAGLSVGPGQPLLLTGPLADDDMPGLYRSADLLAMPSLQEGFGLVVLEALCSGTPVVVSRIAPFTEHLQPDDCGWADPLSVPAIAEALLHTLRHSDPARVTRTAARLAAEFSWARSAARHAALYPTHPTHPTREALRATRTAPCL